jgi:hypothetical protein
LAQSTAGAVEQAAKTESTSRQTNGKDKTKFFIFPPKDFVETVE